MAWWSAWGNPDWKGCSRSVWRDGRHGRIRSGRVVSGQCGVMVGTGESGLEGLYPASVA